MIRKTQNGISWLEFSLLQNIPEIVHGVFLRSGGESQKPFDTLNVSEDVGDDPSHVRENLEKISQILQVPKLVFGKQVHQTCITPISEGSPTCTENTDAFYTKTSQIGLVIRHADCQAAIFVDPKKRIIANAHCGWRGSVQNIYGETIKKLKELGCNPKDLLVCISPSLGPNHAEFINYKQELPESFYSFQKIPYYFDFWEISKHQLQQAGILPNHIEVASICTYENAEDFFSYRREKITGRNATVVALA
ncbi:MAG: peptidoglycan editing factor PgeF [Chlamydiae bacterium]|nr:peptidoglycan editing factor PgeF [Chlamydiota bacterium]